MISALIEAIVRCAWRDRRCSSRASSRSVYAMRTAPLDAIPDISDPQVIVYAKWPRSPQLLESEVTEPVIKALIGSPEIRSIRATSHMGYSFIYVILRKRRDATPCASSSRTDSTRCGSSCPPTRPSASARTRAASAGSTSTRSSISERLRDPRELRLLNEKQIKPALQTVPGVAEVASVGGLEKQYQLKLFPPLLADAGISLRQLIDALQARFRRPAAARSR